MNGATDDAHAEGPVDGLRTARGLRSRAVAAVTGLYLGVAGLVAITLWAILLADLFSLTGLSLGADGRPLLGSVSTLLGAVTLALFYFRWTSDDRSFLDFRAPAARELGYVVVGVVALFVLVGGLSALFAEIGVTTAQHGIEEQARSGSPAILLPLVPASLLFVGPGEELIYRNLVQKRLYRDFSRTGAILVTSAVFALAHLPAFALGAGESALAVGVTLLSVLVLSTVLGVVYDLTRNTTVAALVHGLYDAVVFTMLYVDIAGLPF